MKLSQMIAGSSEACTILHSHVAQFSPIPLHIHLPVHCIRPPCNPVYDEKSGVCWGPLQIYRERKNKRIEASSYVPEKRITIDFMYYLCHPLHKRQAELSRRSGITRRTVRVKIVFSRSGTRMMVESMGNFVYRATVMSV